MSSTEIIRRAKTLTSEIEKQLHQYEKLYLDIEQKCKSQDEEIKRHREKNLKRDKVIRSYVDSSEKD